MNSTINNLQMTNDQLAQLTIRALVLDGKNYFEWVPSIKNYLTSSDECDYLTTKITAATSADVKKASRNVAIKMLNFMQPSIRAMFETETLDACSLWNELLELYGTQSTFGTFKLLKRLTNMKVGDDEQMFISEFIRTIQQLSSHGISFHDKAKSMFLMNAIEHRYPQLVASGMTSNYADFLTKVRNRLCFAAESGSQALASNSFVFKKPSNQQKNWSQNQNAGKGSKNSGSSKKYDGQKNRWKKKGKRGSYHTQCEDDEETADQQDNEDSRNHSGVHSWTTFCLSSHVMRSDEVGCDSCTTDSIMNTDVYFIKDSMRPLVTKIVGGTGAAYSKSIGRVQLPVLTREGQKLTLRIDNVLYAPDYSANVVKPPHNNKRVKLVFDDNLLYLVEKASNHRQTIGFRRPDGIYMLRLQKENDSKLEAKSITFATVNESKSAGISNLSQPTSLATGCRQAKNCDFKPPSKLRVDTERLKFLHAFYGCSCREITAEIARREGIKFVYFGCDVCRANNQVRAIPKHRHTNASKPFEILHLDLAEMPLKSFDGYKYFLLVKDEYSKFRVTILLRNKSDTFSEFAKWFGLMEKLTNLKCNFIHSDNGTEFVNKQFADFCTAKMITHKTTVINSSFQNGIAEREIRSSKHCARKLLDHTLLTDRFWSFAISFGTFVHNRRPNVGLGLKIPGEVFFGKPSLDNREKLLFGSKIYFIEPKSTKEHLNKKPGVFLGYPPLVKGYQVFDLTSGALRIVHDVKSVGEFLPKHIHMNKSEIFVRSGSGVQVEQATHRQQFVTLPLPASVLLSDQLPAVEEDTTGTEILPAFQPAEEDNSYVQDASSTQLDTSRPLTPNGPLPAHNPVNRTARTDPLIEVDSYSDVLAEPIPNTLSDLHRSGGRDEWLEAISTELKALHDNDCVEEVNRPAGKVLSSKLILSNKFDENGRFLKHKARLVVRGFEQELNKEYFRTYQPVVNKAVFRLFLAIANQLGLEIFHIDIKNAYLHAPIDVKLFMEIPPMCQTSGPNKVWRIKKAIYGLKQAGYLWHKSLVTKLIAMGYTQSTRNLCLFFNQRRSFILIYVDDLLVSAPKIEDIEQIKKELASAFMIHEPQEVHNFLNCKVAYDKLKGDLRLSQSNYIQQLADEWSEILPKRIQQIPLSKSVDLAAAALKPVMPSATPFRSLINKLNYIATATRPDIAVATNLLARHSNAPTMELMETALKIVAYLKTTKDVELHYARLDALTFNIYADASFKKIGAASTIGVALMVNGTAFDWECFKSKTSFSSTNEAEFAAIYEAARSAVYYIELMKPAGIPVTLPIEIESDNQGAVGMCTRGVRFDSRDVDANHLKVIQLTEKNYISVLKIDTKLNAADMLTKPLDHETYRKHLYTLGLTNYDQAFVR